MNEWIIILGIAVLIAVVAKGIKKSKKGNANQYEKTDSLFTPAEMAFLKTLEIALEGKYRIFGKVRVADVITVKKTSEKGVWQKAFNKIGMRHFDFVLCDKESLKVIGVVELDDSSHNNKTQKERDEFLNEICKETGVNITRIKAKKTYDIETLKTELNKASPLPFRTLTTVDEANIKAG